MATLLATLHYLALAFGFSAILLRGIRLREATIGGSTQNILVADNMWGFSALLWLVTGLLRAFGGYEKGTEYYLANHWFWLKMLLFLVVFVLEIYPMLVLMRWRTKKKTTLEATDQTAIIRMVRLNNVEACLILLIPFVAVVMARGFR